MQMLCQIANLWTRACRCLQRRGQWLAGLLLLSLSLCGIAQTAPPSASASLLRQVTQWVKQTQQLSENQFSFAPLDTRLKVQGCDRPLAMDLPFSSRETVRVRCVSDAPWQLYMRVVLDDGAPAMPSAKIGEGGPTQARKVVVAAQLLRAGTVLNADMLSETDHSGPGLDPAAIFSIKDVLYGEMVRDVPAGATLRSHDVRRAFVVKQGQVVLLTVTQGNGFAITAQVEALQDGKIGDQVRMKNPESGRLLSGVVTGPNTARGL
jgi:flagella basal body P-ring formation protein FlgA